MLPCSTCSLFHSVNHCQTVQTCTVLMATTTISSQQSSFNLVSTESSSRTRTSAKYFKIPWSSHLIPHSHIVTQRAFYSAYEGFLQRSAVGFVDIFLHLWEYNAQRGESKGKSCCCASPIFVFYSLCFADLYSRCCIFTSSTLLPIIVDFIITYSSFSLSVGLMTI